MSLSSRSFMPALVAGVCATLLLQACGSGSGGSGVGAREDRPPTARPQVLNGGGTNVFRSGSEVLLTGKDSEDEDGPPMGWSWAQTAGPAVRLVELNRTTVRFMAPDVGEPSTLAFDLTVADSQGLTSSAPVEITVVPGLDADKFLSLDLRGARRDTFDRFKVVAALAEGASTGDSPRPFTLSARAYLVYPPRSAQDADCSIDFIDFSAGIPTSTPGGCLVELLEDLTPESLPGGGTGIQGEWPANVPPVVRPDGVTQERIAAEWWNPHFSFRVPRLDVPDFNQPFIDRGERNRMLDLFNAHRTRILLAFELTAPQNQADATLIINDVESAPVPWLAPSQRLARHSKLVTNPGAGLPTLLAMPLEEILGAIPARESALTAEVYYRTVDPLGTRRTLNAWLQQAGFASDGHGTLKPEAVAGTGEFAHGIYLNNYDLGFGRDMYTRVDEFGNVYAFVDNYATLEGAIRGIGRIVTVAMEYSPLNGPADPSEKFVKFFTFADDGSGDARRATSMNFDRRGERFTPGNCIACHGGAKPPGLAELDFNPVCGDRLDAMCYAWPETNADGVNIANGNLHATFLPWDLDSLYFADTDPAIVDAPLRFDGLSLRQRLERDRGDFSRAAQEAQFRRLNQAAHATYCNAAEQAGCATDGARRLVEQWYDGVDEAGTLLGAFGDSGTPPGWRNNEVVPHPTDSATTVVNPDNAEELYHAVYAQHCRMCHTNVFDPTLRFDTYQKLAIFAPLTLVFREGAMPAARLTLDRFWVPQYEGATPAEILAAHMGASIDDLTPRAVIQPVPEVVTRHTPLRLTGHESLFADSFAWEVEYQPPAELAGTMAALTYEPAVVGPTTPEIALVPEMPGTYTARLLINGVDPVAEPSSNLAAARTFAVNNRVPLACDDTVATGGAQVTVAFLQNDRFSLVGSGADCGAEGLVSIPNARDLPVSYELSVSFDENGQHVTPHGGTFTLDRGEACTLSTPQGCADDTLTYEPNPLNPSYVDSLSYILTDVDGESDVGLIEVVVSLELQVTLQDVGDVVSDYPADLRFSITGGILDPGELYTVTLMNNPSRGAVRRNATALGSGASFETDGTPQGMGLVYTSNQFATGPEFVWFRVTDSNGTSRDALFIFSVLPQAPFSTATVDNRQLGTVMQQWESTVDGKLNCRNCHSQNGSEALPEAYNLFNLTNIGNAAGIHSQLVPNRVTLQGGDPDTAIILCWPSTGCPGHTGGEALPSNSHAYSVIRRWIEEGAQAN